jgi:hypothetical protein
MNHNALKWAAIGAGAWLLYRYFTKPKPKADTPPPANTMPGYEYNTGNPNAPVGQEVNKESGWKIFRLGF